MSAKVKRIALLVLGAVFAGGAAVFAVLHLLLPQQRRKAVEGAVRAATDKAEALRAAAAMVEVHAERQVAKVEARVEVEKTQDSVDFANQFIEAEKKP